MVICWKDDLHLELANGKEQGDLVKDKEKGIFFGSLRVDFGGLP
jgi:hypothetical protein